MKNASRNGERGIALFFSIFALLLLTAIAAALIFMANTETAVNSNYRQEQVALFAAKAGVEEARARMMPADPNTINSAGAPLPIAVPTTANNAILYIVNPGSSAGSVQPWNSANAYADDELCHDGYGASFGAATAPDIRCNTSNLPGGTGWYLPYNSAIPFNTTAAALPYKWVRIAPKLNASLSYLTGAGATATITNYLVNTAASVSALICWDGAEEVPLKAGSTKCSDMLNAAGAPMNTVYLLTALGVSSNSPNAARKMVESEVTLNPTAPFPFGLYATSSACPAINFNGNNASTDSYTTAGGGTYASTKTNTGGNIGSNGSVDIGNGNIGGTVGVLQAPPTGSGPCPTPFTAAPNGRDVGPNCPGGSCVPNSATYIPMPFTFPVPPAPNPLPPNTSYTPPNCAGGNKVGQCIVPGTYGNISITGTLTMAPGTYNINSLSMTGNAAIVVDPPGALAFNVGGCGDATCSAANALANPLAIAGNGITDDTIANDFTINYAGAGTISIAGNGDVTAILNAPNSTITQVGNGNWYGSILGGKISLGGNAFFHFDKNSAQAPQ
jgi:hypothetical protein